MSARQFDNQIDYLRSLVYLEWFKPGNKETFMGHKFITRAGYKNLQVFRKPVH